MIYYNNETRWFKSFNEAYPYLLSRVLQNGHAVHPRAGSSLGQTKEVLNASFAIPSMMPLLTIAERKLSYAFALLEPYYLFTNQKETDIVGALTTYAKNLVSLAYNEHTKEFDGNYGDRIHLRAYGTLYEDKNESQLLRCYELLKQDPDSRRAVLTIHNPVWDAVNGDSKDIPCTLNLQFLIRDRKLHCFCQMRSNDIWYGTPHNVMMFTFLQRAMAGWLGVEPGDYIHRANSLHMYEKHWEKAALIIGNVGARDFYLEDVSPRVVYPTHCHPDRTYAAARKMIEIERSIRLSEEKEPFIVDDVYEKVVQDHILAHFNPPK